MDEVIEQVEQKQKEEKEKSDSTDGIKDTIKKIFQSKCEFLEEEVEDGILSGDKKVSLKCSQNSSP